jgi:hypothetical protein
MRLTISRFRVLADSYGANLQRWPESVRAQARALLQDSAQARQIFSQARRVDEAIDALTRERGAHLGSDDSAEAALARLRQRVAVRIGPEANGEARSPAFASISRPQRHWIGLTAAAGVATLLGFAVGFLLYVPVIPDQDLIALLQPSPIHLLIN